MIETLVDKFIGEGASRKTFFARFLRYLNLIRQNCRVKTCHFCVIFVSVLQQVSARIAPNPGPNVQQPLGMRSWETEPLAWL
jgi:hypothetical protein